MRHVSLLANYLVTSLNAGLSTETLMVMEKVIQTILLRPVVVLKDTSITLKIVTIPMQQNIQELTAWMPIHVQEP
jgi:hypothetical protein